MTASSLIDPQVLHEDDRAVVWATLTSAGGWLVFDVHALATSQAGRYLFETAGQTLFDQGRPRLAWGLLREGREQPLPPSGNACGSERLGIWSWTAECPAPADAVHVRLGIPAVGVELDETVSWT